MKKTLIFLASTIFIVIAALFIVSAGTMKPLPKDEHLRLVDNDYHSKIELSNAKLISPLEGNSQVVIPKPAPVEEETTTIIAETATQPQTVEQIEVETICLNVVEIRNERKIVEEDITVEEPIYQVAYVEPEIEYEEEIVEEFYDESTYIEEVCLAYFEEEDIEEEYFYEEEEEIETYEIEEILFLSLDEDSIYYDFEDEDELLTYSGEWIYDEWTDEWYYVEDEEITPEEITNPTGEWLFNYDTEEWYYVEYTDNEEDYYEEWTEDDNSYNEDFDSYEEDNNNQYEEESDEEDWYEESDDEWYEEESNDEWYEDEDEDEWYEEPSYSSLGEEIVAYALSWVGVTPYVSAEYRWTGNGYYNSLVDGTDCSGFTHLIYGAFGIYLPTGSDVYQYGVGTSISYEELRPGDIIVYRYGGHVAIYIGNDQIVHCSNPADGTKVSTMWYTNPTNYLRVVY